MQSYTQRFPTRGLDPEHNQLYFNLNTPTQTKGASIRFRKPGPIIVEKLVDDRRQDQAKNEQLETPLKFSVVSEEKLSLAIQLAKRDLKQRRFEKEQLENEETLSPQKQAKEKKRGTKKGKVDSHRKDGKGESNNKQKQSAVVVLHPRSHNTESRGYILESNQNYKRNVKGNPSEGRSNSVTAPSPSSGPVQRDHDSKQAQEIKRLRQELGHYIKRIEMLSRKGPSPAKDTNSKRHQEVDEVEEQRKQARAAEQASRSARLLYALQQQVREIKDDLDRIGPNQIRHTKKSRTLNRLAAAHRGAVRAIQTFIQQLPSQGETSTGGQPPMYQELALLIRQLSLCCSQMEIGGAGVPDGILDILQQATEFQGNADEETQPKLTSKTTSRKQHNYPMQKKVMTTRKKSAPRPSSRSLIESEQPVRDTEVLRTTTSKVDETPGSKNTYRLGHDVSDGFEEHQEVPLTSERDYALRARLDALIKAKGERKPAPSSCRPGQVRSSTRPGSGLYNPTAGRYNKTSKKTSVLLPNYKRTKRKNTEPQKQAAEDVHFTNATIASQLKTREAVKPPKNPLPPWSPGGVPRRIDTDLNNEGSIASDEMYPLNSPRLSPRASPRHNPRQSPRQSPRYSPRQTQRSARRKVHFEEEDDERLNQMKSDFMEREVARQAWLDKETEKKVLELQSARSKEIDRLTAEVIEEAEEAVRKKFQPLIEHQKQEQHQNQTVEQQLFGSGEAIAGVLDDEAEQLQKIKDEILLEERALDLQEEPTLEKLLQRLEEMETEEDIIRRRLQKITYSSCNDDTVKHKEHTQEDGDTLTLKGTPLDGAELERMSLDVQVPVEHTSLTFTNNKDTKSHKPEVHYRLPKYLAPETQDTESDRETTSVKSQNTAMLKDHTKDYRHRYFESRENDFNPDVRASYYHGNKTNTVASRTEGSRVLMKPRTTLSIPRESRKKIEECRGRFEQHLKKTSHHTYGAFNPWKLVEELSDEIVNELLEGVSEEISNMTEGFVESIYKREFGSSPNKSTS